MARFSLASWFEAVPAHLSRSAGRYPRTGLGYLALLTALAIPPASVGAQPSQPEEGKRDRRIVVSLEQRRLWLMDGPDTLLTAAVAVGKGEVFTWRGRTYDWRTPAGERTVLAKLRNPEWTAPLWHYYERAAGEGLELVEITRGRSYALADGTRLEVHGNDVVRVRGNVFWKVPQGRELIIDGVLYIPPPGTVQRRVPGVLGTRALDLGEGYLIHGTNAYNRASIGSLASHGCIRMRNADVERLFELVDAGTMVHIL